jgi:Uma2 family endonuclease
VTTITMRSAARELKQAAAALPGRLEIHDRNQVKQIIRDRQRRGIDKYDEVWEGVYVMPPLANNPHQRLVGSLTPVYLEVVPRERGDVLPGANVSDRRVHWEKNFRCPDIVVVLKGGRAVDCGTHWFGGPDFLTEVKSPGDDTDEKIPFYSRIHVRELLIIHRDTRQLRLLRHDGRALMDVEPTRFKGKEWLISEVLPLAFRLITLRGEPMTEIRRTDAVSDKWIV